MEIGETRQSDILVLRPVGRIDNLTSTAFQDRLLVAVRAGTGDIVVDFTDVEYISSAGLRALMAASKQKPKERRIVVAALNSVVSEIFAISRFSEVIPVFDNVEAAMAAVSGGVRSDAGTAPIRVHFWGSRGSLPTPLSEAAVRSKVRDALLAARGHDLNTPESIETFIDRELAFSVRGAYGGNTACVEIDTGGDEFVLCDLGSGLREFGRKVLAERGPERKHCYNVFLSHLHWDHIMDSLSLHRPISLGMSSGSMAATSRCVTRCAVSTRSRAFQSISIRSPQRLNLSNWSRGERIRWPAFRFCRSNNFMPATLWVSIFARRKGDRLLDRLRA